MKKLDVKLSVDASGYCRGYYDINYDKMYKDLEKYLKDKGDNESVLEDIAYEFLMDNYFKYLGEFNMVRDDMSKDVSAIIEVN